MKQILFILPLLLFFSCSKKKKEDAKPTETNCDTTGTISYSKQIVPIINASCGNNAGSCHNSSSSFGNFNSYAGFTSHPAMHTLHCVLQDDPNNYKAMPPTGKLGACDITKIKNWIDQGALNN